MKLVGKTWQHAESVAPGTPVVIRLPDAGNTYISVAPGAGGSAKVEVTGAPVDDLDAGSPNVIYAAWAKGLLGVVSDPTSDGLLVPATALRITATVQPARVEVLQQCLPG